MALFGLLSTTTAESTLQGVAGNTLTQSGLSESRIVPFSVSTGGTGATVTTRRPVLSIRPKVTFNDIANRYIILPQSIAAYAAAEACMMEIVYNSEIAFESGGVTGTATFASINDSSIAEYNLSANVITSGGVVASWIVPAGAAVSYSADLQNVSLTLDVYATSPIALSLVATSLSGTPATVTAIANWHEVR
jgi:hypothetical protein